MLGMKTSVTRKKEERSPHRRDEALSDEEKGEERFSWSYEDLIDQKKGRERFSC
ncbi:hypothetical protein LG307_11730 [Sutcliffiella horikoshii]|uniref:hypothetical protein n=1 Tax=Sutcliffiella horikoshii TaxID=79883 RepID=UPI00384E91E4